MTETDYAHNARLTRRSGLNVHQQRQSEQRPIEQPGQKFDMTQAGQPDIVNSVPVHEGMKVYRPFTQEETGYIPLHTNPVQACANCRFFHVDSWEGASYCHIVEGWPEPIQNTGWCKEWRATTPLPEPEPLPVVIVDDMGDMGDMEGMAEKIGSLTTIEQRREAVHWISKIADMIRGERQIGFKISEDGNRWEALYSNNWRDDTGELFPGAKIDAFISRVYAGQAPWPELQYGHLSATTHGICDGLVRIGHHVLAVGRFYDTELASKFKEFGRKCLREGRKLALSHRFWFNPDERTSTGEYGDFDTFEISWFEVLPDVVPANPFTVMEMKTMEISTGLIDSVAKITGDRKRAEELVALSLAQDERAMRERREAKTAPVLQPPASPTAQQPNPQAVNDLTSLESKLSNKLDQAIAQMTDVATKTTAANTAIEARVSAIETTLRGMVAQAKSMQQLAPPPHANPLNLLNTGNQGDAAIAQYLSDQEKKTAANAGQLSLVEYALGVKISDNGVPTQLTKQGGQ